MPLFEGYNPEAFQFLADLRDNNNKEWFKEHKPIYVEQIMEPTRLFVEAMGERLQLLAPIQFDTRMNGAGSARKIYRDVRFSKDKTPYNSHIGIIFWQGDGKKTESPAFYVRLTPEGVWLGAGLYKFPKPYLTAYREAIDEGSTVAQLRNIMLQLAEDGFGIWGEQSKRVPNGFPSTHENADLLKYKGLMVQSQQLIEPKEVNSAEAIDLFFDTFVQFSPLQQWVASINEYVTNEPQRHRDTKNLKKMSW